MYLIRYLQGVRLLDYQIKPLVSAPYFLVRPLNLKVCIDRQNVFSRKFRIDLGKSTPTRKKSKTQMQISQTFQSDSSSFCLGQAKKLSTKVLFTERFISLPYGNTWFAFKNRDPGSSVCDVRHDWCFSLVMIVGWLSLFPQKKRGDSIFPPYMADVFLCGKCLPRWFFQTSGDVWTLGACAFIELWSGILNLECWHWKNASNCKWCIPLKREIRRHTALCDL